MSHEDSMAGRGWWLIELDCFFPLLSNPKWDEFSKDFYEWIAARVSSSLDLPSRSIELAPIRANYVGEYLCLAARSLAAPFPEEAAAEIEAAIRSFLEHTTLDEFFRSLSVPQK